MARESVKVACHPHQASEQQNHEAKKWYSADPDWLKRQLQLHDDNYLPPLRWSRAVIVARAFGGLSTYCFQVCGQVRERGSRNPCMQANLFDFERAVRWLGEETYADSSLYRCINTSRIWGPCPRTFEADGEDCYESDYLVQSRLLRRQDYWKRQEERESAERQRAVRAWSILMSPSSISHRRKTKKKVDASWKDSMPGTASEVHSCRRSLPPGRKIQVSLSMEGEVETMILLSGWRVSGTVLKRRSAETDILE
jgi:hypothetical protein